MVSLMRWTWVWASSRSWLCTGKPGLLQSLGSQTVRPNWVTELNWWLCWGTWWIVLVLVTQSCPTVCNPMFCSPAGLPVHNQLLELAQTHVHWVGDAIQPSHSLLSPSLLAVNLSQHQDLFKWVSSSHQVAKILEFQLPHQSFQWIFRTDLL